MSDTDVVGLSERYAELLWMLRAAKTPVDVARVQLEMLQIEVALSWSRMDFYA